MYAELHCHSYFSLLDAASSPEALVARAKALGLRALALTDHSSLAGAVRFQVAAKQADLRAIIGAEIALDDTDHLGRSPPHLTLLAETQQGYANLCRLLTAAHLRPVSAGENATGPMNNDAWPGKSEPLVTWESLHAHRAGLIALTGCRRGAVASALLRQDVEQARAAASRLRELFGRAQVYVELQQHYLPGDDRLLRGLIALAEAFDLPCVATNNTHYATQDESRLRDALIAIRHIESLNAARVAGRLPANTTWALASPDEMARRFARLPDALRNTLEIAERCGASLDFSERRLPAFAAPDGLTEFEFLYKLCHDQLPRRYLRLTPAILKQLAHELDVIDRAGLAGYFLIVWDLVRFARARGIRCQGRGSAANSLVAYLLGITAIDPLRHHLLFERFLSDDSHTMPDIDLDFAADRREEVIQYVYETYGADHTAMVCNVVTYQARSALRDLGKALDFPAPAVERLARSLDTHSCQQAADQLLAQIDDDAPNDHPLRALAGLMRQIDGCPRHLSIHTGGMLITGPRLDELVPLERATMPGRVVCQWDKDSVEDAGLIKIDLLGLRTLGMISEALGHIADQTGQPPPDLDALNPDDPALYEMLRQADTIGAFQVESRAQQQMLPRLKPERFDDIVIEVAIVRPGPIQGGAVHPYLRRRSGEEPVTYLHPSLEPALAETLGVLLFQEQAIRVAVVAAGLSPGEADQLRRAMSRARSTEAMLALGDRFMAGAVQQGMSRETAAAVFQQLSGFAGFGFCKSHAASFAWIAYQTLWLKHYYPVAFYCALLNQQPMGFYPVEVVVGDMRRHGIALLPPDINQSMWKYAPALPCQTEEGSKGAIRVGLSAVAGLGEHAWQRIATAREAGIFTSLLNLCARTRLPRDTIADLIRAGALDAFDTTPNGRRNLLWALGEIDYAPDELPWSPIVTPVDLPELEAQEQMAWEYELLRLSPMGQVMQFHREALNRAGVLSVAAAKQQPAGRRVRVAGMQAVRQRPPTAKGVAFLSLEDETGLLDAVVRPEVYERYRAALKSRAVVVEGAMQSASGALSLLAYRITGFSLPGPDAR